ncbi:hypothetical protein DSL92_02155 [Billgrantia gudaonensis]|uniref:Uncharacterized protein n=1 Tax=Billgrantia gudaonensis TaxID=376427 RepID=A0A432JL17_9GAMM|nr:hypothetical protein DSL92_02155 [Halomonas gudaonensis]
MAVVYALLVGGLVYRELSGRTVAGPASGVMATRHGDA